MAEVGEINYAELIDRSLGEFRPVKRLWPVGLRLTLWILLSAAIVGIGAGALAGADLWRQLQQPGRLLAITPALLATVVAAYLALRSAIPDRAAGRAELFLVALAVAASILLARVTPPTIGVPLGAVQGAGFSAALYTVGCMAGLAAGPCLALFWAVGRGFPVQARTTAGLIGIAGFSFSLLAGLVLSTWANPPLWQVVMTGILLTALAVIGGAGWLDPARRYRSERGSITSEISPSRWLGLRAMVPAALAVTLALATFLVQADRAKLASIPDFDLAIASYQRSLAGFHPNVPSGSIDAVVTAYVEHGMPAYMWDFGSDGFQLVGGRFDRLADGTPLTYTWFHGSRGGVMCVFKRTDGFAPPALAHEEKRHLFFYRYQGFSVCLINVGGYGSFISVIVAPMPMKEFMPLVLKAAF